MKMKKVSIPNLPDFVGEMAPMEPSKMRTHIEFPLREPGYRPPVYPKAATGKPIAPEIARILDSMIMDDRAPSFRR